MWSNMCQAFAHCRRLPFVFITNNMTAQHSVANVRKPHDQCNVHSELLWTTLFRTSNLIDGVWDVMSKTLKKLFQPSQSLKGKS